jgi:hypothetical protein
MQLSMIMVWKYMNTENSVQRIPYVVVIMICAGGYILTMYPAWQISLAYVLLGIFVWIIWENYKKFHIKIKDILIIIIAVTSIPNSKVTIKSAISLPHQKNAIPFAIGKKRYPR